MSPEQSRYIWRKTIPHIEVWGRVHFHREGFNPAIGSPTATLLRLHPSRRPHRGMRQ
ncbi:hypothetical protein ES288_D04G101900v1 [Gossypium darwinii]|uniref:Uncharacterized protein n=1 Tax=Gossypium darwinii TaxID=34276 RepID=A0A5D2CZN8_GOSDA|nr:hypothetical protein ES288_D04G101900v1 [Gossypium darwinii]